MQAPGPTNPALGRGGRENEGGPGPRGGPESSGGPGGGRSPTPSAPGQAGQHGVCFPRRHPGPPGPHKVAQFPCRAGPPGDIRPGPPMADPGSRGGPPQGSGPPDPTPGPGKTANRRRCVGGGGRGGAGGGNPPQPHGRVQTNLGAGHPSRAASNQPGGVRGQEPVGGQRRVGGPGVRDPTVAGGDIAFGGRGRHGLGGTNAGSGGPNPGLGRLVQARGKPGVAPFRRDVFSRPRGRTGGGAAGEPPRAPPPAVEEPRHGHRRSPGMSGPPRVKTGKPGGIRPAGFFGTGRPVLGPRNAPSSTGRDFSNRAGSDWDPLPDKPPCPGARGPGPADRGRGRWVKIHHRGVTARGWLGFKASGASGRGGRRRKKNDGAKTPGPNPFSAGLDFSAPPPPPPIFRFRQGHRGVPGGGRLNPRTDPGGVRSFHLSFMGRTKKPEGFFKFVFRGPHRTPDVPG